MSWPEVKKINSDLSKTLDALITEKSADLAGMVSLLWPWDRKSLAGTTDITYSTDTILTSRLIYGDVITINSGVTVTTMTGGVIFICNKFINNGTLTASGKGAAGGASPGTGTTHANGNPGADGGQVSSVYIMGASAGSGGSNGSGTDASGAGGASHAGSGGAATSGSAVGNPGVDDYFDFIGVVGVSVAISVMLYFVKNGLLPGAGGGSGSRYNGTPGAGGSGAGAIFIICERFENNGAIRADGVNGENASGTYAGGGGGGGGGWIVVDATIVTVIGTISVVGGTKGTGSGSGKDGGDGGDGVVIINERMAA